MNKIISDQADGLRCLMAQHSGRSATRVVALIGSGPGVGVTSVILNLAAALVQQGQEVLMLDEHDGAPSATALCTLGGNGAAPTGNWAEVAAGVVSLSAAVGRSNSGAMLLPAGKVDPLSVDIRSLFQGQVVLIDARQNPTGALSSLAAQADDVMVVLRPQAASITAAYARIKQLHYAHALQRLRIMINLAVGATQLSQVSQTSEAQRALANLAAAGSRYLGLALEPAGCVVSDAQLVQAQRLKMSVVEAFQTSAAACDFRRIATHMLQWPHKMPVVA